LKMPLGRSSFTFPGLAAAAIDQVLSRLPKMGRRFLEQGASLQRRLEAALGERGVLLHPPYSRPAPKHMGALFTPFDPACTAIFNVLEVPVTVLPTGFDPAGLPVAVQVVGSRGMDHVTLAAAQALEDHFGGWKRATAPRRSAS
jgi:fatty acid amide hydrolase 2